MLRTNQTPVKTFKDKVFILNGKSYVKVYNSVVGKGNRDESGKRK